MKKIFLVSALIMLLSGNAFAYQASILLGARNNGLGGGFNIEFGRYWNSNLRLGVEATSGKNPVLAYFGAKSIITGSSSPMPIYLAGGLVGTFGDKSQLGISLSFVLDRLFGARPVYAELGIDFLDTAKLQAQLGFKL